MISSEGMIYLVHVKFRSSYNWDPDTINSIFLIAPTFVPAIFVHPSRNNPYIADLNLLNIGVNLLFKKRQHGLSLCILNLFQCSHRFISSLRKLQHLL